MSRRKQPLLNKGIGKRLTGESGATILLMQDEMDRRATFKSFVFLLDGWLSNYLDALFSLHCFHLKISNAIKL
jgi:hypothetical protein